MKSANNSFAVTRIATIPRGNVPTDSDPAVAPPSISWLELVEYVREAMPEESVLIDPPLVDELGQYPNSAVLDIGVWTEYPNALEFDPPP